MLQKEIAIIPLDEKNYAILRPLDEEEPLEEDEAVVFSIEELDEEEVLIPERNNATVDKVFDKYYELLKEQGYDIEVVEEQFIKRQSSIAFLKNFYNKIVFQGLFCCRKQLKLLYYCIIV